MTTARPKLPTGQKNIIGRHLRLIRISQGLSQRELSSRMQVYGCDIDKNVITRIENDKRYVSDIELKAFSQILNVSYSDLLDNSDDVIDINSKD